MTRYLFFGVLVLFFLIGAGGCATQQDNDGGSLPVSAGLITPYQTAVPQPSKVVTTEAPTPTTPPLPTPTPFMYTIVENDTMIAIAVRFGVTLDELQAANPGVNPNILSLGTQLVIPISFEDQESVGDQVIPLAEGELACYPLRTEGMWCYWSLKNTQEQPVENISGVVRLYDRSGELAASEKAIPLLNLLEPGAQAPLVAFFPPPVPEWQLAQGQLLSAVVVNQYEDRYLHGSLEDLEVAVSEDGLLADVTGSLKLDPDVDLEYVWVLAVAYDSEGNVAGVRRYDFPKRQLDELLEFDFQVFSLGRSIDHVELLYEVRVRSLSDAGQ